MMNTSIMNFHALPLTAAALLAVLSGCANTPTTSDSQSEIPAAAAAVAVPSGKEAGLQKGMTAEEVKAVMGDPAEIKPLKSPTGKAEIWIYHRSTRGSERQIQVGTKSTPITSVNSSTGTTNVMQTIDEPIFKDQVEIIDETINLLMFDGRFMQLNRAVQSHMQFD